MTKPKDKAGEDGSLKVVLKVDMHCEGCARKVKRSVDGFEGIVFFFDGESLGLGLAANFFLWKLLAIFWCKNQHLGFHET